MVDELLRKPLLDPVGGPDRDHRRGARQAAEDPLRLVSSGAARECYESSSLNLGPIHLNRLTGLSDLVLVVMILLALYLRQEGLMGRKELDEHLAGWLRRVRPAGERQSAP